MPSLMRGGAFVPFTTPLLRIARLRLDGEGRPCALIPALSGGQGYYVVPWPMLPDLISMTVYDRALHDGLTNIVSSDPHFIRAKALEVRSHGLCGPTSAEAAVQELQADRHRREGIFCFLVQRIAVQVGRPIADLDVATMRTPETLEMLRGLANGLEIAPGALVERLDAWSTLLSLLGVSQAELRGPVRLQFGELREMFNVMAEWSGNDHPEYVGSARRCLSAGESILDLIQSQIIRVDRECEHPLGVLVTWQDHAARIKAVTNFTVTATQIWHAATLEWRAVAAQRDRHAMRSRIGFIESLLPVLAPSDILRFQRNRATAGARRSTPSAPPTFKNERPATSDPDSGLREAVIATEDENQALQAMMCWPFRRLIPLPDQRQRPGDVPQDAVTDLVRHLRRTWSARDIARFEAVLAAVDDPERFAQEVSDLRKTVHLMLAEWLSWHGDEKVTAQTAELKRASNVPDLGPDEIYAATMMMCSAHVVALMSGLPSPPIRWITSEAMRLIGATLEDVAAAGYPMGCVGALQLILRELAEPCDFMQTLRHLAAHHGPSVTSNPMMRTVAEALIDRLEELRDAIAEAISSTEGIVRLPDAINRFTVAVQSGVMTMPLKQDGGVAARVGTIIGEVAACLRARLLDQLEALVTDAFPARPDPFSKDADGLIADLGEALDRDALVRVETILNLLHGLRAQNHLFGLNTHLDASRRAVATAADRLAYRLEQAVTRAGAGEADQLQGHVMSVVWLTERAVSSDAADRLRLRIKQMLETPTRQRYG